MNVFNPNQQKTITTLWIPALVLVALRFISAAYFDSLDKMTAHRMLYELLRYGGMLFLIGWDLLLTKKWMRYGIYAAGSVAVTLAGVFLQKGGMIDEFDLLLVSGAALLLRSYLLYGNSKLNALPATIAAYFIGATACYFIYFLPTLPYGLRETVGNNYTIHLLMIFVPFVAYPVIYLVENIVADKEYHRSLISKTTVFSKWAFALILFSACNVFWNSTKDIAFFLEVFVFGHIPAHMPFFLLACLVKCGLGIWLVTQTLPVLWNVLVARMLTTHRTNYLLLVLCLFPVINLIGIAVLFFAKEQNTNAAENTAWYIGRNRSLAVKLLKGFVALISLWGVYEALQPLMGYTPPMPYVLFVILSLAVSAGRIIALLAADQHKLPKILYLLNFGVLLCNLLLNFSDERLLLEINLGLAVLNIILLTEVFAPAINGQSVHELTATQMEAESGQLADDAAPAV
ncbi:hypothetical protein [Deminuibacter soli]|uniref:Uncharacterized protein n=1 Tax=Deminuibacter soli TaxID=2291815 RepID=A0A3E1NCI5_9BACT|nr:hypothetical protein [Deminuibacter soli]RFM25696.1 hypothetical protein DXN05_23585 [Deminuibacter soli]